MNVQRLVDEVCIGVATQGEVSNSEAATMIIGFAERTGQPVMGVALHLVNELGLAPEHKKVVLEQVAFQRVMFCDLEEDIDA